MCVVIANRIGMDNKNIVPNWFLYKIRDRVYTPNYTIEYHTENNIESVYIKDETDGWLEAVNSEGIMLVSATMQNHNDKKEGDTTKKVKHDPVSHKKFDQGARLKKAFKMKKLEDVVKFLEEERFEGNTLVSDGQRLFVLEIFLPKKIKDKYEQEIIKDKPEYDTDDYKKRRELRDLIYSKVQKDEFNVSVEEIIDDNLVVRTNHGINLKGAGYTPKDGEGYESSMNRRKVVIDTIEKLELNNPFDVLTAIKNLGAEEIHKDVMMRPIRIEPCKYITTTIVMLTPTGTMFAVPMDATFENIELDKLVKERTVSFVLLPKNFNLWKIFETKPVKKLKEFFINKIKGY